MRTKHVYSVDPTVDLKQTYIQNFGAGQVATDGVVYSAALTIGTAPTTVLDTLIHPGVALSLDSIYVGLTARFTELANVQGSVMYYWKARSESDYIGTTGKPVQSILAYTTIVPTLSKGVGSLANSEDTLSGYLNVASLPRAPIRIQLIANSALKNASIAGSIKNSTVVKLVGSVIPGA